MQRRRGEGLILFNYSTAIDSLIWGAEVAPDRFLMNVPVTLTDLVTQATAVVNAVGVQDLTIAGYSFGSAPASRFALFHKGRVKNLVFVAPLVVPGDHSSQDVAGKEVLEGFATLSPFIGAILLESVMKDRARTSAVGFIKNLESTRGPLPPQVTGETAATALEAQIRATESFDLRDEDVRTWPRTHFLLTNEEKEPRLTMQKALAATTQLEGIKGKTVILKSSPHTILASKPAASVRMILSIMRRSSSKPKNVDGP